MRFTTNGANESRRKISFHDFQVLKKSWQDGHGSLMQTTPPDDSSTSEGVIIPAHFSDKHRKYFPQICSMKKGQYHHSR
jgi:uncharacterized protein (DUF608 family)